MRKFMIFTLQYLVLTRRRKLREIFGVDNTYLRQKRCIQILVGCEYVTKRFV